MSRRHRLTLQSARARVARCHGANPDHRRQRDDARGAGRDRAPHGPRGGGGVGGRRGAGAVDETGAGADFVITDLKMEGIGGLDVVKAVRELDPDCPVMIVTAFGTVETAVEAMRLGAFDFLQKPFAPEVVRLKVERALELRARAPRARARRGRTRRAARRRGRAVLASARSSARPPAMRAVFQTIEKVAPTDASVYIHGESGTGKELVARAIHARSQARAGPVRQGQLRRADRDAARIELFGHEKGAFTGAIKRKLGRFELADKGTLFLDEIGDVSPAAAGQAAARAAGARVRARRRRGDDQGRRARAVGHAPRHEGRGRGGPVPRGPVLPPARRARVACPPLRERTRGHPAARARTSSPSWAPRTNPAVRGIDDGALARLCAYGWPGNVRELENVIEQALVFAEGERIDVAALPAFVRGGLPENALALPPGKMSLPEILEDLERQLIQKAYDKSGGVKTETRAPAGDQDQRALLQAGEVRHRRHREPRRQGGGPGRPWKKRCSTTVPRDRAGPAGAIVRADHAASVRRAAAVIALAGIGVVFGCAGAGSHERPTPERASAGWRRQPGASRGHGGPRRATSSDRKRGAPATTARVSPGGGRPTASASIRPA